MSDALAFYAALGVDLPDRPGNVKATCIAPEHDDRNPSMSVRTDTGLWKCWSCGRKGGPYDAAIAAGRDTRDAAALVKHFGLWRGA